MTRLTPYERVKRSKLRKAGLLPALPLCSDCNNPYYTLRPDAQSLCHACWLRTPAGRSHRAAQEQARRQRLAQSR